MMDGLKIAVIPSRLAVPERQAYIALLSSTSLDA
jgi:hypothetical protein